jgi:hypothetical protein
MARSSGEKSQQIRPNPAHNVMGPGIAGMVASGAAQGPIYFGQARANANELAE